VHALLLGKNALKTAVLLTRIKLRLILEEALLLHRLLDLLPLVKLRLTLVHLPQLSLLLQRPLLHQLCLCLHLLLWSHLLQLGEVLWSKTHGVRVYTTHARHAGITHVAHTTHSEGALAHAS
jgi:hypothetical protein